MIEKMIIGKLNNLIEITENNQKLLASIIIILTSNKITDEFKSELAKGAMQVLEGK